MKMEAEIRAMQPPVKKCLEPPDAGRDKERVSSGDFGGRVAPTGISILDFWPAEL